MKKFFSNLEDVPMLPADVEIPTKGLDTDEQIDAFDAKYGIRTEDMIKLPVTTVPCYTPV